jgi:hypothetical protein
MGHGRPNPPDFITNGNYIGYCAPCGKAIHLSRKTARQVARQLTSGGRPRAYRCPETGEHWHVGHIPVAVRNGTIDRADWYESRGWAQ